MSGVTQIGRVGSSLQQIRGLGHPIIGLQARGLEAPLGVGLLETVEPK